MAEYRVEEEVPAALVGERVDRVVSMMADLSRSEATRLIADGRVTVNGEAPTKPSERLDLGAVVAVRVPERSTDLEPDPTIDVPIVHIDDDVIVVNKPAGLIVHPGSGVATGTMVQGLIAQYPDLASVGDDHTRPGVVHRLDKGTSGLLLVARTDESYRHLSEQLAARTVLRRYHTLVWSDVAAAEGVVDAPLGRSPRDATRQAVVVGGRFARTHYRVLQRYEDPDRTLLECRLETGRTHQIRVHLDAIDHPVCGDDRYGRGRPLDGLTRPFLHAAEIGFEHPTTGELLHFEAARPADLTNFLAGLVPMG